MAAIVITHSPYRMPRTEKSLELENRPQRASGLLEVLKYTSPVISQELF
jgi:hypothetical protein